MKFKAPIEVESSLVDSSNSSGSAGQVLTSTGVGVDWIDPALLPAESAEKVIQTVRFGEAVSKGDPLVITGYHGSTGPAIVERADATDATKMPAYGVALEDYANNATGLMIAVGDFNDFDTSSYSIGDTLYVAVGGGMTNVKPTGTALIQNMGIVSRSNANNGDVEIVAIGRTNDVPNLPTGRLFVGTATNTSLISDVVYVDDANDRVGIGTTSPATKLEVSGIASFTGSGGRSVVIEGQSAGRIDINGTGGGGYAVGIRFNSSLGGTALSGIWNYGSGTSQQWLALGGTAYNNSAMYILPSGNVGIGTTIPSQKLHVVGQSNLNSVLIGNFDEVLQSDSKCAIFRTQGNAIGIRPSQAGSLILQSRSSLDRDIVFITGATPTERMTIKGTGNVGIGTSSPSGFLTLSKSGETTFDITDIGGHSKRFFVRNSDKTLGIYNNDTGQQRTQFRLLTGAGATNDRLSLLEAGGNVGIGTSALGTPAYGSTPQLVVASSTGGVMDLRSSDANIVANDRFGRLQFSGKDDTSVGYATAAIEAVAYSTAGTGNGGGGILKFMTANFATANPPTERMRITQNGLVGIGTTNPGAKLDVSGDFNVTDSTSYLQVDSTGVNAEGYNVTGQNSGLELQDSVAKIGLDLSNSFVGLNVQTGLGAWLENENVYKFGIAPTLNELTSSGLVQTADTPSNDSRVEGWIKIYDESSGQMFFMPVYL
jgi:hypothetical protein